MRQAGSGPWGAPILVEHRDGVLKRVVWEGRHYRVLDVEAIWCVEGKWWLDRARSGAHRRYFRVSLMAADGSTRCVEIYRQGALWKLWRIAD